MEKIEIYTDGSCRKNPGPGGFGVICFNENKIIQVIKKQNSNITTNNREELKAILTAFKLSQTKYKNKICIIYSDSAYCVNICNDWIHAWARNGWKNSKKKEIENIDLIKELYNYINIDFLIVKFASVEVMQITLKMNLLMLLLLIILKNFLIC